MKEIIDTLEVRVAAAVALIGALREKAAALERQLAGAHAGANAAAPAVGNAGGAPGDRPCAPEALEELERLRAERAVVRERVRALIREIDRVSW